MLLYTFHTTISLQWGRSLRAAEGLSAFQPGGPPARLQWGRSLRAAEGQRRAGLQAGAHSASMGPQLKGCGRFAHIGIVGHQL